ncbi:hypothetical protein Tco_0695366 [Tanacetum coccineum]
MSTEMLLAKEKLIKAIRTCLKNNNQPPEEKSIAVLLAEKSILTVMQTLEEKQIDTENFYRESIDETPPSDSITPDLPIMDSLVMEDERLDIIPEMDSNEEIESSVENLNLTPSESEDLSDYVSECDLPFCDNSPDFNNDSEIFSNPLFDSNADYTSSDDESSSEEDVPVEKDLRFKFPPGNENDHFNAESDLIESLLNKDIVITFPKIDFLLEEFAGELALINQIPPGIVETNFDPKEAIRLIKKLLYDNSSHRPPEELNFENDFERENSGSTTIHTDISLPVFESFDDESDSASEIFNDDLAHIISPSEYEYVYADDEFQLGDFNYRCGEDISRDSQENFNVSSGLLKRSDQIPQIDEDSREPCFTRLHPFWHLIIGNPISLILLTNV